MSTLLNKSAKAQTHARRALLAERLRQVAAAPREIPLSFAQQRLWFFDQLEPDSALYNVPTVAQVTGKLNFNALQRALNDVVKRHEVLRTRFVSVEGTPMQIVEGSVLTDIDVRDLRQVPEEEREREAQLLVRAEVNRPFDLSSGPPIRALLLRLAEHEHWLVLNMHHIVSDEWSLKVCFQELTELYTAHCEMRPPRLPELPIQYADYTLWQREWLKPEILGQELAFWRKQLGSCPPVLELPADHPRPPMQTFRGATESRVIPKEIGTALKQLAECHDATLFMALLAVFEALLHRYTQQDDIVIGSPVAGRNQLESERLIGFFVNTLLLRVDASGDPQFTELLRRVRETTLAAWAHQDLPLEKLVEKLQPERAPTHMPFTHIMFAVQNGVFEELRWPDLKLRFIEPESETAKFDLTFVVQAGENGLALQAEFNRDLFEPESIARMLAHFEILLRGAVANPGQRLSELPMLTSGERQQLVRDWNHTETDYPRDRCIHELFEKQAEQIPAAAAVSFGSQTVTYRELNERANRLARYLRNFGVGRDVPVGICLDRSVEMIVAMLAVLKAGGAYVPLEPAYPKERLAFMVQDAKTKVLLTQQKLMPRVPKAETLLYLDTDWELIARESKENPRNVNVPEDLAYIIYTSGSTGQPKGVAVPHRAVNRLVLNTNYIQFTPSDCIAQVSNASFDAATFEIWGALLNGARLAGISYDVALSPRDFARELRDQKISVMFLTAALFNQIVAEVPDAFAGVRTMMFGGEAGDPKSVARVLQHGAPAHLVNGYGPTENTTFSACYEVREMAEDAATVPIGRPIGNSQCYVLDRHLNLMPIGVPGELHVGGDGLARGYWNRPERTMQKFIANPFRPGELLYKTGDLVRWRADGVLEFLGRLDHQVKIRGFRVEPGEIEAVLARHAGVSECAVVALLDGSGQKRLVAYFVPHGKRGPTPTELQRFLKDKLPDYMVPSVFVRLDALPLTPNGKVDRRALPEPGRGRPLLEKRLATPQDAVELKLTEIWENVLGVHPIGIEDKFFDLGGHSLLAVRLIAQIEKAFGKRLRLATIFQAPTIEQLAAIIREEIQEGSAIAGTSLVEIHSRGTRPPLFLVHGAGGGMFWGYVNLSRHLGEDQPVYGIKSRGLDGNDEFHSIEEMAAQYVKDLRILQPHGPYHLGGYCFGGNVAYEMARQLTDQGEEVALLALFNCAPPNSSYDRIQWTPAWAVRFARNLFAWARDVRRWNPTHRREFFRWKKEQLRRRLELPLGQSNKMDAGNFVDLSSYSESQRKLWQAHIHALATYHPQPWQGRIHLFRSSGHPLLCSFEANYGWGGFAQGGVSISIVPGVHEKILEEPCVASLARELNKVLIATDGKPKVAVPTRPNAPVPAALDNAERVSFWKQHLETAPALLDLPADRLRPAALSGVVGVEKVTLSAKTADALDRLCRAEACPPGIALFSVFEMLLLRYVRTGEIVTGLAVPEISKGTLPVRINLSESASFREVLRHTQKLVREAAVHALPMETIAQALQREANSSYAPVCQVAFGFGRETVAEIDGQNLDLVLHLHKSPGGYQGEIRYSADLFDAPRIGRMNGHFRQLLESAIAEPDRDVRVLPLLPDEERERILVEWNDTGKEFTREATLASLFQAQVARTPGATALIAGTERISYQELDARADAIARLLQSHGVRQGTLVGICLERSWQMIAGILGILKAGGAYVPMDPAYPRDRLAFMLEDTEAPVLLTQTSLKDHLQTGGCRIICLDTPFETGAPGAPIRGPQSDDLAYIIYTSGSTGKPKGVMLEHRHAVALVHWAKDVFTADEIAGVLASTSICFDLSVFEMFVPLSWGGTVILADNALALPGLPAVSEVTMINTVPSAIRELLRAKSVPGSVRVVNLAGEPLATSVVDRIYNETSAGKVYDLYGPSETTTYSTFTLRKAGEPATIGKPLANEQVYLLDRNLQPVPVGVPGEIFIGGAKVGRGYLKRAELTAEKFVPSPFPPGGRLYRTGDLARWREDGNLEFLGRIDHQVKLRGFRIELGEIEAALRAHTGVRDAVVIVREDQPGDKRLTAYVVTKPAQSVTVDELRRLVREKLPEYMAPSAILFLDKLPLTPNGKVDRKALPAPEPDRQAAGGEYVAPTNATEEKLARIWRDVLRMKQVGIHDNFFELGGHSLLAMRVVSQIRTAFKVDPPLSAMFDKPTISALAAGLDSGEWARTDAAVELKPVSREGDIPVSFIQEQLWFFNEMDPASYAYNMPIAFRLRGKLDMAALQKAANELALRHESLRTTFAYADGKLKQVVAPPAPLPLRAVRLAAGADQESELQTLANVEAQQPFDLQAGPLIRMTLFELDAADHALVVVVHHAIADGWSWAIFFEELAAYYDAFATGKPAPALPELPIQYADFAVWRRQQMRGATLERELAYWSEQLKGAPPCIDLPADREENGKLPDRAERRTVQFSKAVADGIVALGRREGCSKFMILMATLGATLQQWTRQQDMVVGTVVAGRSRRETENVIGCFMNFLPIRMQVLGDDTGRTLLAKVRASVLQAQAHQECPFEKIVESVNPERRLNRNPLYNVALLLQNFPEEVFPSRQIEVHPMHVEAHAPLVDLRLEAVEQGGALRLMCEFNTGIFEAATVEQFLESYRGILETLVRQPDARLAELVLTNGLKEQARLSRTRTHSQSLVVASTFTAEPVEESLSHWIKRLELAGKVSFAPFNQVFQQLLDPASLMAANSGGLNVALVRVEDWLDQQPEEAKGAAVVRNAQPAETGVTRIAEEFIAAVKASASRISVPLLVVLCPSSPAHAGRFGQIETRLATELQSAAGVYVVTSGELMDLYPVADFYDANGDELGRVPYTPLFFTALGTIIARKLHALLRPPRKVIVLDCDHTLWKGVCGEDGARGICLDTPYRALQEFMRAQQDAGRLLAVCSKNNEEDVREVFAQRLEMPLRREHFIAWRLNWLPKSENIKSLARELNLGLDSFLFVDDNPVECAEVKANCPEVLTLQLPEDPAQIPAVLKHYWAFDILKVTREDRRRGEMYRQSLEREQLRAQSGSLADFIAGLALKIEVALMTPERVARVSQLTQRTNQFNATTIRRNETEIQQLATSADIFTVSVKDRFGDYGLTGVMICEARGETLDVETFLLSCRVLGRGVEHEMLSKLGAVALERKLRSVNVHFHPSPKNKPAFDFLESMGAQFKQALNGGFVYCFPAEFAAEVTFVPARDTAGENRDTETRRETAASAAPPAVSTRLDFRALALEADSAEKIHAAIERDAPAGAGKRAAHPEATPRTDLERQLCELWQKLLRVERIGISDNFFDLGGHSLLAVRLFAEMQKITGCKLPLVTIFQAPTIAELAPVIEQNQTAAARSVLVPIQPRGSRPPLFLVHGAGGDIVWGYANLAKHTDPEQPIYGIKSRGQIGLDEFDRIDDMARFYIEEIRAFQPAGPYYLGGYCFGGNVAYEMARQLYAQGERVAFLALIDASPSNAGYEQICWWQPGYPFRFAKNLRLWLHDFEQQPRAERRRFISRKLRVLGRRLARRFRRTDGAASVDIEQVVDPIHFPERELKFWQIHLNAAASHVEQPYAGKVTLIRTHGQPLFCSLEKDFCWGKLARGGVEVKYIPGSHESIFMEPHVKVLAEQLEQCLGELKKPEDPQETLSHGLA